MRLSMLLSSWPRGMYTTPGIAPCSNSSGSRTSRTTAPAVRCSSASAVVISRISAFVFFSRSRKSGIGLVLSRRPAKAYRSTQQLGKAADSLRAAADGRQDVGDRAPHQHLGDRVHLGGLQ